MGIADGLQSLVSARVVSWPVAACALACVGCTDVETKEQFSYGAWGVHQMYGDLEASLFQYKGEDANRIEGEIRKWARGSTESGANSRLASVTSGFSVGNGQALASSTVEDKERSGVEFELAGPSYLDTTLTVSGGGLQVSDVSGQHYWDASNVVGTNIEGDFELTSERGEVDLSLMPFPGGNVSLELKQGSAVVYLPHGLPYDLQVWGSPDSSISVEGLGLEKVHQETGFFAGQTQDGSIRIRVDLSGGRLRVKRR